MTGTSSRGCFATTHSQPGPRSSCSLPKGTRETWSVRTAGVNAFLVKPCPPPVLLAEVRKLIQLSRELRKHARASTRRLPTNLQGPRRCNGVCQRDDLRLCPGPSRASTRERRQRLRPISVCPTCDAILAYERSHIGGVNQDHSEQWDYYYECPSGCGTFQVPKANPEAPPVSLAAPVRTALLDLDGSRLAQGSP